MLSTFKNDLSFARSLDAEDPLHAFRDEFILPAQNGKPLIYLLGNSLGLQPRKSKVYIQEILHQWANFGVEGFFKGDQPWDSYHDHLVKPMAAIVGAQPAEIVVMNQLTVNLHLMLTSFYQPSGKRKKIICEAKAFPSDQYMLETHVGSRGFDPEEVIIEVQPRAGEHTIRTEDLVAAIQLHAAELALVCIGGVNYYTGQAFDIRTISAAAHQAGALAGFDLAHAAGNIPMALHEWKVDFACWCTYKYLNAGPGAVGAAFIHQKYHHDATYPRLAGWWGYDKSTRFNMEKGFVPITSAEGWALSTPSMLQFATLRASLEIFEMAGMERLLRKGQLLNDYFRFLLNEIVQQSDEPPFVIFTPSKQEEKGNQVSLFFPDNGKKIFDALEEAGVMADWREPGVIRMSPVPLYNTFEEVWVCANALLTILQRQPAKTIQ